jgi:NADH:ubiquinone oxidoreductase subunit D
MARSAGIKRDLRLSKLDTYANYYYLNFRSYIGNHGDCYDRFLIRMNEMAECTNIITQSINSITKYNNNNYSNIIPHQLLQYVLPKHLSKVNYKNSYISMENLIEDFKYWSEGFNIK